MGSVGVKRTGIPGIFKMPLGTHIIDRWYMGQRIYYNFRDHGALQLKDAEKYLRNCEERIAKRIILQENVAPLAVSRILRKFWTHSFNNNPRGCEGDR